MWILLHLMLLIVQHFNLMQLLILDAIPSTSGSFLIPSFSRLLPLAFGFSPGVVRPLPKAGPRKEMLARSKRKHKEILTDTQENSDLWQIKKFILESEILLILLHQQKKRHEKI